MAYGAGEARAKDGRRKVDETFSFGFIRGLQGSGADVDWSDSAEVILDREALAATGSEGRHLDLPPEAESSTTWEHWREALVENVVTSTGVGVYSCPKLRMKSDDGESEAAFRRRVEIAVREKRDEAVDKLRERYQRKVDRLEDRLDRAREALARQEDQARDAQLKAAVNVGEALWGMLGGRRRRVSSSRATRVIKEKRDVERAEEKVEDVVAELHDLQAEMEAALIEEAEEITIDAYPIDGDTVRPNERDVEVLYCGLVWVPYWIAPDGSRRRAH